MGPNKGGVKEKEYGAYHLLPPGEAETAKIYHLKLNDAVLEQLKAKPGKASIKLTDGNQSQTKLSIGDRQWTVQWIQQAAGSSENAVIDCLVEKDGYYCTLGALTAKATIRDDVGVDMVAKKLQGKNQEAESRQRKREAGMKIETVKDSSSSKKRKSNHHTVIGDDDDIVSAVKPKKKHEKEPLDEAQLLRLKERVVHALAIRDMTHRELNEALKEDVPKKVCLEVATSDQSMGAPLFKILPKVLLSVDVSHEDYLKHEKELVQARRNLVTKFDVSVQSDEDVEKWKAEFETRNKALNRKDAWLMEQRGLYEKRLTQLKEKQKDFEAQKVKKEEVKKYKGEIIAKYERSSMEIMKTHAEYLQIFDEMSAIKDAIRNYKKAQKKRG